MKKNESKIQKNDKKVVKKSKKDLKKKSDEFLSDVFGEDEKINWDTHEEVDDQIIKDSLPDIPMNKQVSNLDDNLFELRKSTIRRTTEEGWPVYDVDELHMGKGGFTDKCPFECDCCF